MPPEIQEKAEAADRVVLCITQVILLVVVALLIHGSLISVYEVGLTADNWESALGMGVLLSLFSLGMSELLLRNVPPENVQKEPESRGPVAAWYGIKTLGSFTHEFWRAFCIVSLIRLGVPAWVAVLITAAAYGTPHLQTSTARALGSAAFGSAAGFLFVNTGSLLAPLTMSLIVAGANLYQVRNASSLTEQTNGDRRIKRPMPRYLRPCPACGAIIRPADIHLHGDSFPCPSCSEWLTQDQKYIWGFCAICLGAAAYETWHTGYRGAVFILITIGGTLLLSLVGVFLQGLLVSPKYKRVQGKPFDNKLTMFATDKTDSDKEPRP
jgi:predicted RNA-binding Zn-ribbon protein involved in translation (DUF1610 family)